MRKLTVRLADEKHARLKTLAQSQGTTLNALIDEMTTIILVEHDARVRFEARATRGAKKQHRGVELTAIYPSHKLGAIGLGGNRVPITITAPSRLRSC